jgi:hypothetical protein
MERLKKEGAVEGHCLMGAWGAGGVGAGPGPAVSLVAGIDVIESVKYRPWSWNSDQLQLKQGIQVCGFWGLARARPYFISFSFDSKL